MSNVQTPLWVSLLLASIALIGPIGAAMVTSRNNNKRWEKENVQAMRRDESQWRRDRFRILLDSKSSWRDLRLEKYSQTLDLMDRMHRAAVKLMIDKRNGVLGASTGDSEDFLLFGDVQKCLEELALISNTEVRVAVYKMHDYLFKMLHHLTSDRRTDAAESLVRAAEQSRAFEDQRNLVRKVIRQDLAAEIPDIA